MKEGKEMGRRASELLQVRNKETRHDCTLCKGTS